jgi:3-hydroxy-3-methylglutaryl CoA synthase
MADERYDFTALRPILGGFGGRNAYNAGDGLMAQVVDDLGLIVGEDVAPARPDSIDRPTGGASRAEWARYAQIQASASGSPTSDEIDAMTRDQLRDLYLDPEPATKSTKAGKGDAPAPVKGD